MEIDTQTVTDDEIETIRAGATATVPRAEMREPAN